MFHTKDDNRDDIEPEIKTEVQKDESLPDFDSLLPPPIIDDDNDKEKVVEGLYLIYLLRYIYLFIYNVQDQ